MFRNIEMQKKKLLHQGSNSIIPEKIIECDKNEEQQTSFKG